jgi:nucleotide-binding universal stress UspA family protein
VALDEIGTAQSALAFAFAVASRSKRELTVLRCVPIGDTAHTEDAEQTRTVAAFAELHQDVPVTTEVTVGDPTDALVAMSLTAVLLVLGSRGRGRLASSLFGSVSRTLIRRGGCPVVVARARRETRRTTATG